jgi:hypothetical protein
MKKSIAFFYVLISFIILYSNPIYDGLYLNEVYFDDSGWQIEFVSYMSQYTLDNCALSSTSQSYGYSDFLEGITIYPNMYFVVNQNDMQAWLSIDPLEDHILSYDVNGSTNGCAYGNYSYGVLAPLPGQSLVPVSFCLDPVGIITSRYSKCNSPTLGYINAGGGVIGTFSGYVYDSQMNPIPDVQIEHYPYSYTNPDIFTDENGYFEKEMYGTIFDFNIHLGNIVSIDSLIQIEPDSLNFYEFVFENYVHSDDHEIELPVSFYNLSNHPNPFNPNTEISFQISDFNDQNLEIQIFNTKGQRINVIFPSLCHPELVEGRGKISVEWNGKNHSGKSCPSGVYFYKLISGDKELAANKMLLLK